MSRSCRTRRSTSVPSASTGPSARPSSVSERPGSPRILAAMSTEIAATPAESKPRPGGRPQGDTVCWFDGQWTPLADAKVGIMTHSFLYGTAVFEGIRAYWNEEQGQLYLLRLREHYERIRDSSKILLMDPGYTVE